MKIKIRVWNKHFEYMMYSHEHKGIEALLFNDKGETIIQEGDGDQEYWEEEYPIMLYTGLTDKNSKEIFEGDIVKCSYFKMSVGENLGATEVDAELIGVIQFNDLSLVVSNIQGEKWSHYTGYGVGEGSCEITYLHDVYEGSTEAEMSIEIIGNVFENKKLLSHDTIKPN